MNENLLEKHQLGYKMNGLSKIISENQQLEKNAKNTYGYLQALVQLRVAFSGHQKYLRFLHSCILIIRSYPGFL